MACFTYERVQGVWRFWWFLNEILKGSAPGFMEDFLISCWLESGTGTCQLQLVQSQIYRLFASWKRLKCPKFVGKPQPCRLSSQGGRICRNPNSNPNPNSTKPPQKKTKLKDKSTKVSRWTSLRSGILTPTIDQGTGFLCLRIRHRTQGASPCHTWPVDGEPNTTATGGWQTLALGRLLQGAFRVKDHRADLVQIHLRKWGNEKRVKQAVHGSKSRKYHLFLCLHIYIYIQYIHTFVSHSSPSLRFSSNPTPEPCQKKKRWNKFFFQKFLATNWGTKCSQLVFCKMEPLSFSENDSMVKFSEMVKASGWRFTFTCQRADAKCWRKQHSKHTIIIGKIQL